MKLIPISQVIAKARGREFPVHRNIVTKFIKDHKIVIAGTAPMGRGISHLVDEASAEHVRAIVKKELEAKKPQALTPEESPVEIHVGAIEAKCDRIETSLARLNAAVNELIKANNVLADKQAKVLSSLGAS